MSISLIHMATSVTFLLPQYICITGTGQGPIVLHMSCSQESQRACSIVCLPSQHELVMKHIKTRYIMGCNVCNPGWHVWEVLISISGSEVTRLQPITGLEILLKTLVSNDFTSVPDLLDNRFEIWPSKIGETSSMRSMCKVRNHKSIFKSAALTTLLKVEGYEVRFVWGKVWL